MMSDLDLKRDSLDVLKAKESMLVNCMGLIEQAGWRGIAIGLLLGFLAGVTASTLLAGIVLVMKLM